ncbi:AhpD family alkylhydroperoxidase [Branchiibius hedensis]|uniref:Alkylhydroperoxidase AhpD family core domain-containing protein n=1 Tax=Branchiibius hedensis TaxID=672460 RepID=A0A2Y8ZNC0_9MICO|nr:carboxymuconolactone decarboxylase family protein [Branchiibius hedensis]PWJ25106.1 AhpD family alkylhydroperoxidase [Branchiibius hedensis]SSA33921.1 alkylhydroperoxidase AhpD family core domain-containing protein [Branchiibius hedensis]
MSTGRQNPRVRPGRLGQIGVTAWVLARAGGRLAKTEPMDLFRVLGRNKGLFRGWLHFAGRLMPFGTLPRAESELVILRVAALRGSDYELHQHRRIARGAGLSREQIALVGTDLADGDWTDRQRVILAAVDQLVLTRDVDDCAWAEVAEHLDDRQLVELVLLAGHYDMLAAAIRALRIQPETPLR